jgi:hypothetical protein
MSQDHEPVVVTAMPPRIAEIDLFGPIGEHDEQLEYFPEPDHDNPDDVGEVIDHCLIDLLEDDDDEERDDDAMLELLAMLGFDLGADDEPVELAVVADLRDDVLTAREDEHESIGSAS